MSKFTVNSAQLRQKANALNELNQQFRTAVNELTNSEQSLASMWEGDAQKAFHKAFSDDVQQFTNFYNGIAKYIQALQEAADKYDKAEAQNVNLATARS